MNGGTGLARKLLAQLRRMPNATPAAALRRLVKVALTKEKR